MVESIQKEGQLMIYGPLICNYLHGANLSKIIYLRKFIEGEIISFALERLQRFLIMRGS